MSRRHGFALLAFVQLCLVGCRPEGKPTALPDPPRPRRRYSVAQFLATVSHGGASFSPDGSRLLVHSDASGVFNLYALPVDGGEPVPLTRSAERSLFAEGYFPVDERILYRSDPAGGGGDHLYVREADGRTRDLTPGEGHRAVFYGWADDQRRFYIGTNERDERTFDVYQIDAATYRRELVLENTPGFDFADVTADGRWVVLSKTHSLLDADLYFLDRQTGQVQLLTPHEGDITYRPLAFAPSGRRLLYLTDEGHEFLYLVELDLETAERRVVWRAERDVLFAEISRGGGYLVVGVDADARSELHVLDTATGAASALPELLPGVEVTEVEFAANDAAMALTAASPSGPRDLFVQALPEGEPRQLTYALGPEIDPEDLVEPEVVRFPSLDGLEIPGLLYRPHQASPEASVPALVWLHAGRGGQSRVGYEALVQYLVNQGTAVLAVNHRGSAGYGKTFLAFADRAPGEGILDDAVAGRALLARTGWVDGERIGILGEGHGGTLALAALVLRPEGFVAGVDRFGPLAHPPSLRRPLLVLRDASEPGPVRPEPKVGLASAGADGVPVEVVLVDGDRPHLATRASRELAYGAIGEFLDRTLGGGRLTGGAGGGETKPPSPENRP